VSDVLCCCCAYLQLRLAGNALALGGDLAAAVQRYTAALAVQPQRGQHLLHSNLAAAYLQLGEKEAALEHAQLAVEKGPRGFHNVSSSPSAASKQADSQSSPQTGETHMHRCRLLVVSLQLYPAL
jgi:tetratricopeptide (TPR) repeat protein